MCGVFHSLSAHRHLVKDQGDGIARGKALRLRRATALQPVADAGPQDCLDILGIHDIPPGQQGPGPRRPQQRQTGPG